MLDIKLSIITVCKNNLKGLKKTHNSIIHKFKKNKKFKFFTWEWIVIDGFSEDGTINYLQKIKNKNVFFISEKDDGIFSAMNKGITASKGNYLYFLNSGDVLHENFSLEIILKNLRAYEPYQLAGNVLAINKEDQKIHSLYPWVCHQATIVRSDCFKITKFNETLKFYGDLYFWKVLKKNSFFKPLRINMIFCEFKMGGLGNSPSTLIQRMFERDKIAALEKENIFYRFIRILKFLIDYLIFNLLGSRIFYKLVIFRAS